MLPQQAFEGLAVTALGPDDLRVERVAHGRGRRGVRVTAPPDHRPWIWASATRPRPSSLTWVNQMRTASASPGLQVEADATGRGVDLLRRDRCTPVPRSPAGVGPSTDVDAWPSTRSSAT